MKGIVFTEFLELIEEEFSQEVADDIVDESDLRSGGAYTAVGTYDHGELVALVGKLSEKTGIPLSDLIGTFGRYLFTRFYALYPVFFEGVTGCFDFLETIENHVHVEVRKLYPDAELPTFQTERLGPDSLVMIYASRRPFADLAHALIEGAVAHWGEDISIEREDLSGSDNSRPASNARFTLRRSA